MSSGEDRKSLAETVRFNLYPTVLTVIGTAVGIALFLAGLGALLYNYWVEEGFNPRTVLFWVGIGGILAGLAGFVGLLRFNERRAAEDPYVRQALAVYNFVLVVCFLAGILIILNLLVAQYGYLVGLRTYDWTSEGIYTLHDQSINQVKALEKPVKIYILYPYSQKRTQLIELIRLYEAVNPPMIDYEIVDYMENRVRTQELLREFPDLQGQLPGLLIVYGEGAEQRHKVIRDSELFTFALSLDPLQPETQTTFTGENAITSAIRELRQGRKTKVYFTTGHGEMVIDDQDPQSMQGIGIVVQELRNQMVEVETINLIQKQVPEDADIVVIAGPRTPFREEEISRLRDFLDRRDSQGRPRGSLFILIDSPFEFRSGTVHDLNLNQLLKDYRVELADNLVIDRAAAYGGVAEFIALVPPTEDLHPILKPLLGEQVLFGVAREVKPLEGDGEESGNDLEAKTILTTVGRDPLAWAEGDYQTRQIRPGGPNDSPGPVSLMVVVEQKVGDQPTPPDHPPVGDQQRETIGRVVVLGDATAASNTFVSVNPTNLYLVLNTIHWLGGRIEDVGIPPKTKRTTRLVLDRVKTYLLIFEPGFALIGAAIIIGGMVWVVRGHRYGLAWLPYAITLLLLGGFFAAILARIGDSEDLVRTLVRFAVFQTIVWAVCLTFAGFAYLRVRRQPASPSAA